MTTEREGHATGGNADAPNTLTTERESAALEHLIACQGPCMDGVSARTLRDAIARLSRLEEALERIRDFKRTLDDEGDDITAGRMRYIARTGLGSETKGETP